MKTQKQKNKYKKGFTLIELLVAISIIGVLSSIVLASINTARINARDARRISDIRQMRIALELYRLDNGDYPIIPPWGASSTDANWNTTGTLHTALAPYMATLPVDPVNVGGGPWQTVGQNYTYVYGYDPTNGTFTYGINKKYDLVAQFENTNNPLGCATKLWVFYAFTEVWCSVGGGGWSGNLYSGDY